MFCGECGNQISDDALFCGKCGAKVVKEEVEQEVEVTAEETTMPEVEAPSSTPEKKKTKGPKVLIAVVTAVAVLTGVFFAFREAIINKAMFYMPAEKQFQYVCKTAAEDFVEKTNEYIARVEKTEVPTEVTNKGNMSVTLGDFVKSAIGSYAGIELDDIDTVSTDYEIAYSENQYRISMGIGLKKADLITVDVVMDLKNGKMAITVPELSKSAIEVDMQEDMELSAEYLEMIEKSSEESVKVVKEVLPEDQFVEELVFRYVEAFIKAIDEVEREKGTVEVGDVSQKATSLTIVFDDKMVEDIGDAITDELKNDEELKKYIKFTIDSIAELVDEEVDKEDYEEIFDELIDAVDEMFQSIAESDVIEDGLELMIWINGKNEIIGVEFGEYIEIASVKDGQKVASRILISDEDTEYMEFIVEGEKDKKDDSFAGNLKLYVQEKQIAKIEVARYLYTEEEFALDASVKAGKGIGEMTGLGSAVETAALGIDIKATAESSEIELSGKYQGKELVAIRFTTESSEKADITYPKDANSIDEISSWLETVDVSKLLEKLDESGILDILGYEKDTLATYLEYAMSFY